jgi:hypothetical protein
MKEKADVERASERRAEAEAQMKAIEADLEREVEATTRADASGVQIDTMDITPRRGSVQVRLVALAWKPLDHRT